MNTRTNPVIGAPLCWVKRSPRIALSIAALFVLLLSLVGVFAFHNPFRVAAATGSIALSPTSGPAGTHVLVTGTGFKAAVGTTPGELVKTIWNYKGPGTGVTQNSFYEYNPTVNADASGDVTTSFWVSTAAAG